MPPPRERGESSSGGLGWETVLSDLAIQAGGGTVAVRDGAGGIKELTAADLADAADKITHAIEARPPSPGERDAGRGAGGEGRDILVLGGALDDPATRALLSWATVAGAALLLETDPGNVLGAAVWARPTVFAGTVDETVRLRSAAERHDQGWTRRLFRKLGRKLGRRRGLPFGRLHTLLVTDSGPLPQEDEAFWRERGVAVRFLPQCGIAWYISR